LARLRIRIELSRGGVGVPLHKLANVVGEAQKFFHMVSEDVHIDMDKGEWLVFDFDRENLDFTAEFIGPVSPQQAQDFNAAFGGTTSLRRATIAQFARIADAIGEEEIIGFGLYESDELSEPNEWRCLSRRDALRIADEIQLLLGVSEEYVPESRLPAVRDPGLGARIFGDRRERAIDQLRLADYVREMETSLSSRLTRMESKVEQHSGIIHDLRSQSETTEETFRHLLTSIESFCAQATRQIEQVSPVAALPAAPPAPVAVPAAVPVAEPEPVEQPPAQSLRWPAIAAMLAVGFGLVLTTLWLWPARTASSSSGNVQASEKPPEVARETTPPDAAKQPPVVEPEPAKPGAVPPAAPMHPAPPKRVQAMRIDLEAKELTWVSLVDSDGNKLLTALLAPGDPRTVELLKAATLRIGNAAGLSVRVDGKAVGPLGPAGRVREIEFKDGTFKVAAPQ